MAESESIKTVGMDMCAPFRVYVDGKQVATYDTERDASKHYNRLRQYPTRAPRFFVARVEQHQNGSKTRDVPLSREVDRLSIIWRVLKRIRRHEPTAYAVEVRRF